ncbi:hypothetical protein C1701_19215 [Actinoalloteichus sp. AHMU CJ021]|nr:hypothetical protein C1701_19215 [Actinoalloteichus sp. AHMU CJ021]
MECEEVVSRSWSGGQVRGRHLDGQRPRRPYWLNGSSGGSGDEVDHRLDRRAGGSGQESGEQPYGGPRYPPAVALVAGPDEPGSWRTCSSPIRVLDRRPRRRSRRLAVPASVPDVRGPGVEVLRGGRSPSADRLPRRLRHGGGGDQRVGAVDSAP